MFGYHSDQSLSLTNLCPLEKKLIMSLFSVQLLQQLFSNREDKYYFKIHLIHVYTDFKRETTLPSTSLDPHALWPPLL